MTLIRWGLIGTGAVSRSFAEDLTETAGSYRLAVASRTQERARQFAVEVGFERSYGDLEDFLADPDIDIVHIGTPHGTHRDLAIRALAAGKHVVVEKPIGLNRAEAEEIRDAAQAAGRFAIEGMWMKFNPAYRRMIDDLRGGAIGEPRSVRASFGIPFPTDTGSRWSAELGGSTLLDQGIYPVTLALNLFGTPTEIIARGQVRDDGVDLAEHITLEFPRGRYAQLAASMVEFCELTATVNGTDGWVNVPTPFWASPAYVTRSAAQGERFVEGVETRIPLVGNGFTPMIEHITSAVREGSTISDIHPLGDTIAVFDVLDEIRVQLTRLRA